MDDFNFNRLRNLFKEECLSKDIKNSCPLLKENHESSRYRECTLKGFGKNFLIEINGEEKLWRDKFSWTKLLETSTEKLPKNCKLHNKCDYVLFNMIEDKITIFLIELKGTRNRTEVASAKQQIHKTFFYFKYVMSLIKAYSGLVDIGKVNYYGMVLGVEGLKQNIRSSKIKPTFYKNELNIFILSPLDVLNLNTLNLGG